MKRARDVPALRRRAGATAGRMRLRSSGRAVAPVMTIREARIEPA